LSWLEVIYKEDIGFDLVEEIVIIFVFLIIVGAILGSMWAY